MLSDTITAEQYRVFNNITNHVPALFADKCAEGLHRLKLLLQEPYIACGYYHRAGAANSIVTVKGKLAKKERADLAYMLHDDQTFEECGYWFIHADEDDKTYVSYSYYHIAL